MVRGVSALLGAACLVKGIVAWAFPFVIVIAYLVLTRQWRRWREFYPATGILLSVITVRWWFAAIDRREPDFFNFFFIGEHLQRFSTTKHSRTGQLWYFVPVVLGLLFPWTAALVPAVKRLYKEGLFKLSNPAARPFIYMAVWALSIFCVFSISSSKRPPYMIPLMPPLAVMLAWWFDRIWTERDGFFRWFAIPYAVLAVLVAIGMFVALPHVKYLDPAVMPSVIAPALALIFSAALAVYYARRGNAPELYRVVFIFAVIFLGSAYYQAGKLDNLLSRKAMAQRIMSEYRAGERIISFNAFWERNMQSLTFYTGKRVLVVGAPGELKFGATHDKEAAVNFPSEERFLEMLRDDSVRSYIVAHTEQLPDLERAAGKPIYPAPDKLPGKLTLFSNKPWRSAP